VVLTVTLAAAIAVAAVVVEPPVQLRQWREQQR
jgi:hypothetical protein